MKKALILAMGLLMLFSISSFATETRTLVMGDNNMILVDDANIWLFPGRLLNYPNIAIGEFTSARNNFDGFGSPVESGFYKTGVHWQFGSDNPWIVATYIATTPAGSPMNLYTGVRLTRWDMLPLAHHERGADLMISHAVGGYNAGFHFSGRSTIYKNDVTDDKEEESYNRYLFKLGVSEPLGKWDLGFGLQFGSWKDKDEDGEDVTEVDGDFDMSALFRIFFVANPTWDVIPHLGFGYSKRGQKDHFADDSISTKSDVDTKTTRFEFGGGVGLAYSPAPAVFAVIDLSGMFRTEKQERTWAAVPGTPDPTTAGNDESKRSTFVGGWRLGVEGDVFKWMTLRLGATGLGFGEADQFATSQGPTFSTNEQYAWNDNTTYLGLGFHWDRLYIDTYTSPQLVLDGFNFISGSTDARNMNFQVTLLYEMF